MRGIIVGLGFLSHQWLKSRCSFLWCIWAAQRCRNMFLAYCGRLQVCQSPDEHWRALGEFCRNKWACLLIVPFSGCCCFREHQAAFGVSCWEIYSVGDEKVLRLVVLAYYSIVGSMCFVLLTPVSFLVSMTLVSLDFQYILMWKSTAALGEITICHLIQ